MGLEVDTEVSLGEGDTELGPGGGGHRGSSESRLSPPPCCNKGTERKATPTGSRRGLGAVRGEPVSWLPGTLRVLRIFFSYLRFPQDSSKGDSRKNIRFRVKRPVIQPHLHLLGQVISGLRSAHL